MKTIFLTNLKTTFETHWRTLTDEGRHLKWVKLATLTAMKV